MTPATTVTIVTLNSTYVLHLEAKRWERTYTNGGSPSLRTAYGTYNTWEVRGNILLMWCPPFVKGMTGRLITSSVIRTLEAK
jgi:hypothetical protein